MEVEVFSFGVLGFRWVKSGSFSSLKGGFVVFFSVSSFFFLVVFTFFSCFRGCLMVLMVCLSSF